MNINLKVMRMKYILVVGILLVLFGCDKNQEKIIILKEIKF